MTWRILKKNWKANLSEDDAIRLAIQALKAGEKGVKPSEIELAIINPKGFTKYYGEDASKFIKKYW